MNQQAGSDVGIEAANKVVQDIKVATYERTKKIEIFSDYNQDIIMRIHRQTVTVDETNLKVIKAEPVRIIQKTMSQVAAETLDLTSIGMPLEISALATGGIMGMWADKWAE